MSGEYLFQCALNMAKNTSRDKVWTAAIGLRDDLADPSKDPLASYMSSFRVPEVVSWLERHGEDVPSERTISDALESMAAGGVVEQVTGGGHGKWARYGPPESMQAAEPGACEVCGERFGIAGGDRMDLTMWKHNDAPEQTYHFCRECLAAYPDLSSRE